MNQRQRRGAAAIGFIVIASVGLFLVGLTLVVMLTDDPLGNRFPGRQFMLMIQNWSALGIALKGLPPLLTICITAFANYKMRDWQFYATLGATVVGTFCALYLVLEVSAVETARRFWAYSPVGGLDDYASFVAAARIGLIAIIAWFLAVISFELGIKARSDSE